MHAVARLALHPHITNIQASWVKMGPQRAAQLLAGEADGVACVGKGCLLVSRTPALGWACKGLIGAAPHAILKCLPHVDQ